QRAYRRRAATLGPSTFLIERVAEDLSDRLATVLRRFECAVDLGTPIDAVRRALAASGRSALSSPPTPWPATSRSHATMRGKRSRRRNERASGSERASE